ncbi:MAG: immune inhibitor A [Dehalococcoidia bacterium]
MPRADRVELAHRLRGVTAPTAIPPPADEQPGERRPFWVVQTEPPRAFQVNATLRVTSPHALMYVQDDLRISDADMDAAAREFETVVYPSVTGWFGGPALSGGETAPRITILHLRLPNVAGYFTALDQLPKAIAPISNERRMIYVDISGGPPGSAAYRGLVAHEFQHLLHQDRSPYADTWLNEGLSDLVAELVGGAGSSLRAYANNPDTQLTTWPVGSTAAHYGAAHSFLRYVLRHYGGIERAGDLVARGGRGVNAVDGYLRDGGWGVGFDDVFADWLVASYLNLTDGPYANPGEDARVRSVTRLATPRRGDATVNQFGADYFEIEPGRRGRSFSFQGASSVSLTPNPPAGGQGQWWSNRGDSLNATLTRALDLRGVTTATLRFKTWYDIERGWDFAYVLVSTDDGATWTVLRGQRSSDFDPLSQGYGPAYTGRSGEGAAGWQDEQIDLGALAGQRVLLRFQYITDEAAAAPGFMLDDIAVPEIGFFDDAEGESDWTADGFRRVTAPVVQRYLLQVATEAGGVWSVRRVEAGQDGSASIPIPADVERAVVIVAGVTHDAYLPAAYRWALEER